MILLFALLNHRFYLLRQIKHALPDQSGHQELQKQECSSDTHRAMFGNAQDVSSRVCRDIHMTLLQNDNATIPG